LLYLLVSSASFFAVLIWGIFARYDYGTHLVWENIVVFFYVIAFVLFSVLPKRKRSLAPSLLGFTLLGTAVLEWSHALVYPGLYAFHPGLTVEYWIYARGLFTAGVFVVALIKRNFFKGRLSNFLARMPYFPVVIAAFLIFASHFIPGEVFYNSATTVWKPLLEIVFAGVLFISAYLIRSEKPFALALLLAGLGEMSFVSFRAGLLTSHVVGLAFIVASAVTIGIWAAKEYVFVPFNQLEEIAGSYNVEIKELAQKVRQKERDLEDLTNKLKQTDEYRINFLRSISHELKTPLSVILGNIQLIEMGVFGDATHLSEPVKAIETATRRAEHLVNNLLDLSRVETGRLAVKSELVRFSTLEPIIKQHEDLARQKGLDFKFDLVGQELFSCDFKLLSAIISNLLSNAVRYTEEGAVRGKLEVSSDRIIVEVSDTGRGISREELERIFEPFQGDKTAVSSGLGLAIVKRFVDLMNGVITVESEEGKGTKFHVELPRLQRPTSFEAKEHVQVLVVEPDRETRELVKRTLKGYSLVEAVTGAEAYLKALEHTPDLVVTTVGLPDVSGEELIKKLKGESSLLNTRFVLYTGARIKNAEVVTIEKGADIKEVASKFATILEKKTLLTCTKQMEQYLPLAEKMLERFTDKEYTVKAWEEVTDEDVGLYDAFVLLVSEKELEKVGAVMDRIFASAHVKCLILILSEGKLKWHE